MKEGFGNSFPKRDTAPVAIEKTIHGISESKIHTAIERVKEKRGTRIDKVTLVAIIKDIETRRDQGEAFREARTFATRRFAGNYGKEYWAAVLSALGMVYPRQKKKPTNRKIKNIKISN